MYQFDGPLVHFPRSEGVNFFFFLKKEREVSVTNCATTGHSNFTGISCDYHKHQHRTNHTSKGERVEGNKLTATMNAPMQVQ